MYTVKPGTQTLIYTGTILMSPIYGPGSLLVASCSEMTVRYIQSITCFAGFQEALLYRAIQEMCPSVAFILCALTDPLLALQKQKGTCLNIFSPLQHLCVCTDQSLLSAETPVAIGKHLGGNCCVWGTDGGPRNRISL